jgi:hypothetical protein
VRDRVLGGLKPNSAVAHRFVERVFDFVFALRGDARLRPQIPNVAGRTAELDRNKWSMVNAACRCPAASISLRWPRGRP